MTLADVLRQTYRDQRNAVPRYRVEDVMTISEREDAAASGLPPDAFEAIWRAIGWLYRSGTLSRPAPGPFPRAWPMERSRMTWPRWRRHTVTLGCRPER